MTATLLSAALVCYIVGILASALATFQRAELARRTASLVFGLAWTAHLGAVVARGVTAHRFPLASIAEYLLFLGLAVMTLHLVVSWGRGVHVAGLVLPPLAAVAGGAALALLGTHAAEPVARSQGWFLFHTTVSTLGMATLVVALAMSAIYLFQDRALKSRRRLKILERLPPLDRCDQIGFQALVLGFVLLSIGIGAGVVVNASRYHRLWIPGLKQTPPLLAWIVFAAVLVARFKLGFRGRKSAYLTIAGVMLGLLTVAGMARL